MQNVIFFYLLNYTEVHALSDDFAYTGRDESHNEDEYGIKLMINNANINSRKKQRPSPSCPTTDFGQMTTGQLQSILTINVL